ncbi:hypothetical protein FDECE_4976 [Fusarium decemcellulare]|nr:hypothetical protein FDECE_4976 [Fusarium decemcellulare]
MDSSSVLSDNSIILFPLIGFSNRPTQRSRTRSHRSPSSYKTPSALAPVDVNRLGALEYSDSADLRLPVHSTDDCHNTMPRSVLNIVCHFSAASSMGQLACRSSGGPRSADVGLHVHRIKNQSIWRQRDCSRRGGRRRVKWQGASLPRWPSTQRIFCNTVPLVSMALHHHLAPPGDIKTSTRARNDQPFSPRTARTEPPLGWPAGIASGLVDLPSEAPRSQSLLTDPSQAIHAYASSIATSDTRSDVSANFPLLLSAYDEPDRSLALQGIISEHPKLLQTNRPARSQQTHDEKNATERRRLSACKNTLMDEPGV